jgi:hypothetical protein
MPEPSRKPRRRARNSDGTFDKGVEPIAIERDVTEKEVTQEITTEVTGTSQPDENKYSPKKKVTRPTFGNVTTTYH